MGDSPRFQKRAVPSVVKILNALEENQYPSQIARSIGISKQNCAKYIDKLEKAEYIKQNLRDAISGYILTDEGKLFLKNLRKSKPFLLSVRSPIDSAPIRTHTFALKLAILKDNPSADFSKEEEYHAAKKGNGNWTTQYFKLSVPVGMTIEKTTQNVEIHFHRFWTEPNQLMSTFFQKAWSGCLYVTQYFEKKYGIKLDIYAPKVVQHHTAYERPDLDKVVEKQTKATVSLGRKANAIFPANFDAKAWVERSMGNGIVDIESNDMPYAEKLLLLPEIVHDRLAPAVAAQGTALKELNDKLTPALGTLTAQIVGYAQEIANHREAVINMNLAAQKTAKTQDGLFDAIQLLNRNIAQSPPTSKPKEAMNPQTILSLPDGPGGGKPRKIRDWREEEP